MKNVRLGIIGTNFVSDWLCGAVKLSEGITNHAVYSRTEEKGREFAARHDIGTVYTDLEKFFKSDIEAVYIASPNYLHHDYAMKAIENGKHVLVEKPAALNTREFSEILTAAMSKGVQIIEAMRPAHDPAMDTVKEEIKKIGTIRRAVFDFCQYSSRYDKYKAGEILNAFNPELGNAALMDIGVYAVHACVMLFGKPKNIFAKSVILPNGMEGMGSVFLDYGDFQAEVVYSKITESAAPSFITGENGSVMLGKISMMDSVSVKMRGEAEKIHVSDRFSGENGDTNMIYEVSDFVKIINGALSAEKFNQNTKITLEIMDEIRKQNAIVFPSEK